jgi:hypothetical protein
VWLITWEKAEPVNDISREEVLDALVAYGCTDGLMRKLDAARVTQPISPRHRRRVYGGDKGEPHHGDS